MVIWLSVNATPALPFVTRPNTARQNYGRNDPPNPFHFLTQSHLSTEIEIELVLGLRNEFYFGYFEAYCKKEAKC